MPYVGLLRALREYAPHLRDSFVSDETWWNENWGTPEAHVRLSSSFPF